jgi:hypothetical protein
MKCAPAMAVAKSVNVHKCSMCLRWDRNIGVGGPFRDLDSQHLWGWIWQNGNLLKYHIV